MSAAAWCVCAIWLAAALAVALWRGGTAVRRGRARDALRRLRSPTVYMFAAYLLVAALVTPTSAGESTSPLLWLAIALPIAYAASAFAAAADERPTAAVRLLLAALFGGAVLAAAAIILALVSPLFVPRWLR
jgi:cytochrome bd-type quinol oxidase subunit 2